MSYKSIPQEFPTRVSRKSVYDTPSTMGDAGWPSGPVRIVGETKNKIEKSWKDKEEIKKEASKVRVWPTALRFWLWLWLVACSTFGAAGSWVPPGGTGSSLVGV